MNFEDDVDDPTPIMCRGCGSKFTFGAGPSASECPICRGGISRPTYWRATRERVMTTDGLEALLDDLVARLDRESSPLTRALIQQGRDLAAIIHSWRTAPPSPDDRSPTIQAVADWHLRAWTALEKQRARG